MIRVSDEMVHAMQEHLSSPAKAHKLMARHLKKYPELLSQEIDKVNLSSEDRPLAEHFAASQMPKLVAQAAPEMAEEALTALRALGPAMVKMAKDAHKKALEEDFFRAGRADIHKRWSFVVKRYDEDRLVLPDTALAFIGPRECAPFSQKDSNFSHVFVPISDQVVVVGFAKHPDHRSADALNRILASCAHESFAARSNTPVFRRLCKRIGKNAEMISKSQLRRIFSFKHLLEGM